MKILVHVNAKDNDGYNKQISFLRWSIKKYRIPAELIVVDGYAKDEYQVIKNRSETNRLYCISTFIKKRGLLTEDIIVLDPDTIFVNEIDQDKYKRKSNEIYTQNYSDYFSIFPVMTNTAKQLYGSTVKATVCPFIGKGKTISDLFDLSLYTMLGYYKKNLDSRWETGMWAIGAAMNIGNFIIVDDYFWPVANFHENKFKKYDGIHYGFEIPLKNGKSFKKWNSFESFNSEPINTNNHVSVNFINHLKEFEKSGL